MVVSLVISKSIDEGGVASVTGCDIVGRSKPEFVVSNLLVSLLPL